LGALLYCIGNYIVAIPKREGNGWSCYGPGNDNSQGVQNFNPADTGGNQFNWALWYLLNELANQPSGQSGPSD
jgi:hypothetical protein